MPQCPHGFARVELRFAAKNIKSSVLYIINQVAYGDYLEIAALQTAPGSSSTLSGTVSRFELCINFCSV